MMSATSQIEAVFHFLSTLPTLPFLISHSVLKKNFEVTSFFTDSSLNSTVFKVHDNNSYYVSKSSSNPLPFNFANTSFSNLSFSSGVK